MKIVVSWEPITGDMISALVSSREFFVINRASSRRRHRVDRDDLVWRARKMAHMLKLKYERYAYEEHEFK